MIDRTKFQWMQRGILCAVCALVVVTYAYLTVPAAWEAFSLDAADAYYNQLVDGFRSGQLNLRKEAPPELANLANPYDPIANGPYRSPPYRLHDLSYFNGKLYMYFGVTPAVVLFWPVVALTGRHLFQSQAVTIFCALGFLASVCLLWSIWRRYFAEVSVAVVAAGALALGLAAGIPLLLSRADVNEVAISCGYMFTMLGLGALWRALHEHERSWRWLAAASAAYGLAVGARPSLVLGAIILLVPVIHARCQRRPVGIALLAATGPIVLIGLGLMVYNALRFGNPFEFGQRYQLSPEWYDAVQHFHLRYLWFNFRVYFLKSVEWSQQFPFVERMVPPPLPVGHGPVERPVGILLNMPAVWLATAAPLACRDRSSLKGLAVSLAILVCVCAMTILLYNWVNYRYQIDFLPSLMLLAVLGIFGLESALAGRPFWRGAARLSWGMLLAFSVAFNLLASIESGAGTEGNVGDALAKAGRTQEAIPHYERALRIKPNFPDAHNNLGVALERTGRSQQAVAHYEMAVHLKPDYADAAYNLAAALWQTGRHEEAIARWEQLLRIEPELVDVQRNLAAAYNDLGASWWRSGRFADAVRSYERALQLVPDSAEAHYNLAGALEYTGNLSSAVQHYQQALRIRPGFREAQDRLARLTKVENLTR